VLVRRQHGICAGRHLRDEHLLRDGVDLGPVEVLPAIAVGIVLTGELVPEIDRLDPVRDLEPRPSRTSRTAPSTSLSSHSGAPLTPCQKPPHCSVRRNSRNSSSGEPRKR
jgi:hypothetical protein